MDPVRRRWAGLVVAALVLAACSDTGLSGQVPVTDEPTAPSTPAPTTTLPDSGSAPDPGSGGQVNPAEPDGFLVFENLSTPSSLWTIEANGQGKTELAPVAGQALSDPQISPDGAALAFLATPLPPPAPPGTPPPAAPPKLWVAGTDGSQSRPLTFDSVPDTCFAWAPDGQRLLSATTDPATNTTVARILSIGGETPPEPLSFSGPAGTCPVFLDENLLLFPAPGDGQIAPTPRADAIASAFLDGGAGPELVRLPDCTVGDVRVGPDGQTVALAATCDDPAATGIYTVGDGGVPVIAIPGSTGAFAWSPDAGWLAYTRADPANPLATSEILISRPNGSDARRLVAPPHQAPTWGPLDGGGGASDPRV